MGFKWIQWLKDYNGNKINLCVPVGKSAQEVAEDADYYLTLSYQGWQPPDYNTWGIFPFHIALAQSCIANATAAGCEDVNFYLAEFGVGSSIQYHFMSGETITSQADSQYLQTYNCQFFRPSAGLNLMNSYPSSVNVNVSVNNYRYPAIAIDEENQRAIFCSIQVGRGYVDPDPHGGVLFEVLTQSDASRAQFYNAILSSVPPVKQDPYNAGGNSNDQLQTGDSTGNFDDTSDTISIPGLPSLNLASNGFIKVWVPTLTDLDDLATIMYGNFDKTDPQQWVSKIFADPRDGIVALFMLPFTPSTSTAIQATIGQHLLIRPDTTDFDMTPVTTQFQEVDCGSVSLAEYYGNYLDYNPYTRITLFLPFVGEVQLDPDEVMGESVSVKYHVDCYSGCFVAFVATSDKVLAQYQGYMAAQVPYTSADYSRLNQAVLGAATAAVGIAGGVAVGGAAIAGAAGLSVYGMQGAGEALASGVNALGSAGMGAASQATQMQGAKVNHSHSGALGGSAGFMGNQTPYMIIHRARQSVPPDANTFRGYPCNASFQLSDLRGTGFTKVSDIILNDCPYSDAEQAELRQILAAGIIL